MQGKYLKLTAVGLILQVIPFTGIFSHANNESPLQIYIPNLKCGFEFNVSALLLRPSTSNLDYGIIATPLPLQIPDWQIQSVKPRFRAGFDIGAGFVFPEGADLQLSWRHLHTNDFAAASADATQFVGPFYQIGPNTGLPPAQSSRRLNGRAKFNFDVVNLDAGHFVNFGPCARIRFIGGLSAAYIKEQLIATFQGNTFSLTSNNSSSYMGIGPRLGVNANAEIFEGFGIIGQMTGSLLIGSMQPKTYFASSSNVLTATGISLNQQSISAKASMQVVPGLDAKLGINYSRKLGCNSLLTIEAGYLVATYFNSITVYNPNSLAAPLQSGTIAVETMGKNQSNFSVSGPYLNFKVKM